jgi:hypothetical protein
MVRFLAGLFIAIWLPSLAAAAEWQYCLAPSHYDRKIYISGVFPVTLPRDTEHEFMQSLNQSHFTYQDVQCPLSDNESSAVIMQQHTISFNRDLGNQIIKFPWKPTP